MDEATIISALAAKAMPTERTVDPTKSQAEQVAPLVEEVVKDANGTGNYPQTSETLANLMGDDLFHFFAVPFEMQRDGVTRQQLTDITSWISSSVGSTDRLAIMTALRDLEGRLGLTFRNDSKLATIYRYLKLDSQRRNIEQEMSIV